MTDLYVLDPTIRRMPFLWPVYYTQHGSQGWPLSQNQVLAPLPPPVIHKPIPVRRGPGCKYPHFAYGSRF